MRTKIGLLLACILCGVGFADATLIRLRPPGTIINSPQSIDVIAIDRNGNALVIRGRYSPLAGGIELNTSWAGPKSSIYIPSWGVGYIWVNGFWVDEWGYYWNGLSRQRINIPNWRQFWIRYWLPYWNDSRGYWLNSNYRLDSRIWRSRNRALQRRQLEAGRIRGFGEVNKPSKRRHWWQF